MQTQQQKPAPQQSQATAPRLSVGEIVIGVLDLLIGAVATWIAFDLLIKVGDSPVYAIGGVPAAITALGVLGAGLAIFLRQRRLAVYAQWLGTLGLVTFFVAMFGIALSNRGGSPLTPGEIFTALPLFALAVLFGWFAWFLKRMDDSK